MMKKLLIVLIIAIIIFASFSGCSRKAENGGFFDIPEGAKIQTVLDDMSDALMAGDIDKLALYFSDICPGRKAELDRFRGLLADIKLKTYEQTVKKSSRLKDGVVCSIEVHYEGTGKEKNINNSFMKEIYFVFEKESFKIGDYNYYPYMNPTVVVGSDSILYDSALSMSEALNSNLTTDKEHLQTYGDIIMVGGPYDNASILELEEKGLTHVKVTDEYPGGSTGIVQVVADAGNYRHALIIQGSSIKAAEDAIRYMTRYLGDNPYMNPGVYFVEDERLRKASPLDLTTLITLDSSKASQRLREVQKHMEANLALIEEELQAGKEQLTKEYRYLRSPFREDYYSAYERHGFNDEESAKFGMAAINAGFTDPGLCASVFQLPYGSTLGTLYAYARYISEAPMVGSSMASGDMSRYGTAALRLLGFGEDEVFSTSSEGYNAVFSNIGSGYIIASSSVTPYTAESKFRSDEIVVLQNEGSYIDYKHSISNMSREDIFQISDKLSEICNPGSKLSKEKLSKEKLSKTNFKTDTLAKSTYLPYDTGDIYTLFRSTFISNDEPCAYSTLEEAKMRLRLAMGELLAVKCTSFIVTTAAKYPGSQFDYALYVSGLINVEHPNAYAEAAEKAKQVNKLSRGISNVLSDDASKIEKLLDMLSSISETGTKDNSDRFIFPDVSISSKSGSHRDKALLAFGLYSSLFGDAKDAYVAIGENNSYLVFKSDEAWKYIDCQSDVLRSFINDDISLVFNKKFVYNKNLGIGKEPEFLN